MERIDTKLPFTETTRTTSFDESNKMSGDRWEESRPFAGRAESNGDVARNTSSGSSGDRESLCTLLNNPRIIMIMIIYVTTILGRG